MSLTTVGLFLGIHSALLTLFIIVIVHVTVEMLLAGLVPVHDRFSSPSNFPK